MPILSQLKRSLCSLMVSLQITHKIHICILVITQYTANGKGLEVKYSCKETYTSIREGKHLLGSTILYMRVLNTEL